MNEENKTSEDNKDEGSPASSKETSDKNSKPVKAESPDTETESSNVKEASSDTEIESSDVEAASSGTKKASESDIKSEEKSEEKPKKVVKKPEDIKLNGIYATKLGMSVIYDSDGSAIPVTALQFDDWIVSQIKSDERDGYCAVQIVSGKKSGLKKSEEGHLKRSKLTSAVKFTKEVRCSSVDGIQPGAKVSLDSLKKGDIVKITSRSKGRGFAGTVKRYGFGGGPASHGSKSHRKPGSIGMCEEPGRVLPGRSMPGRFGFKTVTIRNAKVAEILSDKNVLFVKGGVPGARNTLVKLEKQVLRNQASA